MANEKEIIRLYETGKTLREIAPLVGCCYQNVQHILRKNGVSRRRAGRETIGRGYKHRAWIRDLKHRYNLTEAGYLTLLEKQGGVCAICKRKPKIRLSVDHVHDDSKKIRGLLCNACNNAIGLLKDNPAFAFTLYTYLAQ